MATTSGGARRRVCAILLAAGEGERLGIGRPKAFAALGGRALLSWSLEELDGCDCVDDIVIVGPDDWIDRIELLVDELGCGKVVTVVVGGDSRAASVLCGLRTIPDTTGVIALVHDAARPLVACDVVERILASMGDGVDGVVPVLAVTDTIKQVSEGGEIVSTPDRALLRSAQTPQACDASKLLHALESVPAADLAQVTDCTQAIERAGGRIRSVDGDERMMKVTTIQDLEMVERMIAGVAT